MRFLDRFAEMDRLERLMQQAEGGLAVIYGRRRIGKTRLLLEWSRRHDGLYTVADQSAAGIQRRYFADAVATRLPGFADVEYRDWRTLLLRLAREAQVAGWRGPVIFDELPYLVTASPDLPSLLQRWIDHEARSARLVVAVAGSSQRMMQGFVLQPDAPLFGRAREVLDLGPIDAAYLREAFAPASNVELIELYTAWGGIPRYWELASSLRFSVRQQIDHLVLDPLGPLHREPDRLLIEEVPSALEVRPVLDAIGAGAHRVSEIAGRLGRPATSMSRPLDRLLGMGLIRREIPFGELEKTSRRSLYKIADPFFRLWFRVVAPYRGPLASGSRQVRLRLLARFWDELAAQAWEDLCRQQIPHLPSSTLLGRHGPWGPATRWWERTAPEWDLVSESMAGGDLLLGEVKWSTKPWSAKALARARSELAARPAPLLPQRYGSRPAVRALFVPEVEPSAKTASREGGGPFVITADELLRPQKVDAQYQRAYGGVQDPLGKDFEGWEDEGVWPPE
jgi:AAA+ ATPase superfamily predicted ATPase